LPILPRMRGTTQSLAEAKDEAKDVHRRSKAHAPHAADHRTPQPEFPRRDGFLDHRRRAGTRGDADAHEPKGAPWPELEHSVSRSGICREHASPADPNRFAANRLASSTSSAYRDAARGEMRVVSAFGLGRRRDGVCGTAAPLRLSDAPLRPAACRSLGTCCCHLHTGMRPVSNASLGVASETLLWRLDE
jgi:hypothetical protein